MGKYKTGLLLAGLLLSGILYGQNGAGQTGSTGQEGGGARNGRILKNSGKDKLSVFQGFWRAKPGANATDKTEAVYSCSWSPNGRFLVCDQLITRNGESNSNLSIYSYDSLDHYTLTLVGLPGIAPYSTPVISRQDTLIYPGEYMDNGQKVYSRTLNIFITPRLYKWVVQTSKDGANWTTSVEGASEKVKD